MAVRKRKASSKAVSPTSKKSSSKRGRPTGSAKKSTESKVSSRKKTSSKVAPKSKKVIGKKRGKKKKSERVKTATPIGRLSYPYLLETKSSGQYPSDQFECELLCTLEEFNGPVGRALQDKVVDLYNTNAYAECESWDELESPFKIIPAADSPTGEEVVRIRARTDYKPDVVDAQKQLMTEEQVGEIKGGDYGRLVVVPYYWEKKEGGVSLSLEMVQFWKAGEAFGQGNAEALETLDELEVELEDLDDAQEEDDDEDFEEESEEEESEEEEDSEEEEWEDDEEDEEEWDDEEEGDDDDFE